MIALDLEFIEGIFRKRIGDSGLTESWLPPTDDASKNWGIFSLGV
jgi:hypothetical protein